MAADMPVKAPMYKTVYSWTGFYLGGHVGYGDASFGAGTNPLPEQGMLFPSTATGVTGGYQAGYVRQLPNNIVLGVEADASFTGPLDVPRLTPRAVQHDRRLCRHRARPGRLRVRNNNALCDRGLCLGAQPRQSP